MCCYNQLPATSHKSINTVVGDSMHVYFMPSYSVTMTPIIVISKLWWASHTILCSLSCAIQHIPQGVHLTILDHVVSSCLHWHLACRLVKQRTESVNSSYMAQCTYAVLDICWRFLQARCPSCCPTNSVRTLKGSWMLICIVGGDFDESFACHIALVVTTTSIILSSSKSRMETFWYQLTLVHLENGH